MTDLDLAEIAADEVDLSSAEADALGLRLELDLQPTPVRGEHALLERLVGNLVENSIRHNLPNGWFSVKTRTVGDKAVLTVANSGPIVPSEELERLFERFYRPDRSRSRKTGGFGLGLSIVKSVATAHGGDGPVGRACRRRAGSHRHPARGHAGDTPASRRPERPRPEPRRPLHSSEPLRQAEHDHEEPRARV